GATVMTSSPASSSALRTVFSAAPAPTVMMTWPAVYGSPVTAVRRLATASRTRTWPAFGMYACRGGSVLSRTRRAAASTAGGGSGRGEHRGRGLDLGVTEREVEGLGGAALLLEARAFLEHSTDPGGFR